MNARLLEKMVRYREGHKIEFAKVMISQKIENQFAILNQRSKFSKYEKDISNCLGIEDILLIEARAAREYWKLFGEEISRDGKIKWTGRMAHRKDTANQLLDIGYHYLTQRIAGIFKELTIPTELGFLHKAQSRNSLPLVYDFIEWLRPIAVDEILMKMIHKKKKPVEINKKIIPNLIFKIKSKFDQKYYHKKLGYCVTLDYWVRLLVLNFEESVSDNKPYKPIFPSLRHETRCKACKIKPPELGSRR